MRIAVMGTGGVGGYFGARLAAAGNDVRFVARGAHLGAMRRDGLRVESAVGDVRVLPVTASDRPEELVSGELGPVDAVLFAVKLWDTEAAAEACRPLLGPETAVITTQNGIDSVERLAAVLGPERIVGGSVHIAAVIAEPGVIRHTGTLARITIGELDGHESARVQRFAETARAAGIETVVSPDIRRTIWEKFVLLSSFSGVTTLLRRPAGPIREDADTRAFLRDAIAESVAVARAEGVDLPPDQVERTLSFIDGFPAEMKSSMLGDLERGARLELPWLSGAVVRLAARHGIVAPVHRAIAAALKLHANGPGRP